MDIFKELADEIVEKSGSQENIKTVVNCMTRVRMTVFNKERVLLEDLKSIKGVLRVLDEDNMLQIVVGPGTAQKVQELINKNNTSLKNQDEVKQEIKQKYGTKLGSSLKSISNIFVPLIPGFIACGLLQGISNIFSSELLLGAVGEKAPDLVKLLALMGSSVFFYMNAMIGANTAKESGGSAVLGMIMAAILFNPKLNEISLLGMEFSAGRGGVFALLMSGYIVAQIEKGIRKSIPNSLDLFLTSLLTILITTPIVLFIIQPIGGVLSVGITQGVTFLLSMGGFISGFLLAGLFLPLVMTGIHQGLIPIMTDMLNTSGINLLLPILAMAGAGQVGAVVAVLVKTKNSKLKKTIKSSLIPGVLGVGEPLIYGVTLPLGRPFIGACIGGAFGGGVVALFKVGALIPGGLSGILLTASININQMMFYILGVITAYIMGFFATYVLGFKDPI